VRNWYWRDNWSDTQLRRAQWFRNWQWSLVSSTFHQITVLSAYTRTPKMFHIAIDLLFRPHYMLSKDYYFGKDDTFRQSSATVNLWIHYHTALPDGNQKWFSRFGLLLRRYINVDINSALTQAAWYWIEIASQASFSPQNGRHSGDANWKRCCTINSASNGPTVVKQRPMSISDDVLSLTNDLFCFLIHWS